ncbi:MAG: hypothetical protein NTV33_01595 [Coprothermobacterota bacterium]|nr:hypothetical protein [Coprothermobacterota bacterium]
MQAAPLQAIGRHAKDVFGSGVGEAKLLFGINKTYALAYVFKQRAIAIFALPQGLLGLLAISDVSAFAEDRRRVSVLVPDQAKGILRPEDGTILFIELQLKDSAEVVSGVCHHLGHLLKKGGHGRLQRGRGELLIKRQLLDFFQRIPSQFLRRRTGIGCLQVHVHQPDSVDHRVGQQAVESFALPQRLLGPLPCSGLPRWSLFVVHRCPTFIVRYFQGSLEHRLGHWGQI